MDRRDAVDLDQDLGCRQLAFDRRARRWVGCKDLGIDAIHLITIAYVG
jgi:hypothetical protein